MCASTWYFELKTASGSLSSLVGLLPQPVKTRSGGYLGQSPARVGVPDGWPAQFGWNGWKIILCRTRVRVGSDAWTARVSQTVHSGWCAFLHSNLKHNFKQQICCLNEHWKQINCLECSGRMNQGMGAVNFISAQSAMRFTKEKGENIA